ncbi:MAG: hypothetical protein P0S96_01920 [Simkaniaceae bacterium]|nr:hypothetical protein [Candidatus Sacchlamyda saccharinae]
MATQQDVTLSNPFAAEHAAFYRTAEKNGKNEKKELAKLGAALKFIKEEIVAAKSGESVGAEDPSQPANSTPGASNTKFENSMDSMVLALQELQVMMARYNKTVSSSSAKIANAYVTIAQTEAKDIQKKLKEINKKEKTKKDLTLAEKIAEDVLGGVTVIAGIVLAQPELVVMGALSIAAGAGLFQEATKWTAKGLMALSKAGVLPAMTPEEANMIAAIAVCVLVIAVSVAASDPEAAVEEAGEAAGEEATDAAGDDATQALDSTEAESKGTWETIKNSKVGKAISTINKAIGPRGRMAIFSLMTSLNGTQVVQKSYAFGATEEHVSKKEQKKIEQEITIAIAIASMIVMALTGAGAAADGQSLAKGATGLSKLGTKMMVAGDVALGAGVLGSAGAQFGEAEIMLAVGQLQKHLADNNSVVQLMDTLIKMNSTAEKESQEAQERVIDSIRTDVKATTGLMNGIAGFANASVYSSPV